MQPPDISAEIFADQARAARNLRAIHEMFIAAASRFPVEAFTAALGTQLSRAADPDMALTNLLRYAEAALSKVSLFNDLVSYPVTLEVLLAVFGSSRYFADILVRDPELFRWLTASDILVRARTQAEVAEDIAQVLRRFHRPERTLDALRRLFRREVLRIGVRDILGEADLATTTQELSTLADLLIEASCRIALLQVGERCPEPPAASYTVLGLGKLGGCELNYSSDVDLLIVYEREGDLKDVNGKSATYHEFFNRFAERVVQNLSQNTVEGHLYRVDMRLRPESGAGPLARSSESYLLYYESRGELWERQMLIKARPVAGDIQFGNRFVEQLTPFVYPKSFFHDPAEEIARIKARVEAAIEGEENIKLRAGGIRDIEFIVQALQLLNGGKNPEVRARNTLMAITQLAAKKLLSTNEATVLTDAYVFFRNLEHRLQTMLNTQTHTLPPDEAIQRGIARRLGLHSASELREVSARHMNAVRGIFDNVLRSEVPESAVTVFSLLEGSVQAVGATKLLSSYGFRDAKQAAKNLAFLLTGTSLTQARELDSRTRDAFRGVAPDVFAEIAATPSPDMTLRNLTSFGGAQKFPEQFYQQLKERNFRKLVLRLCASSPYLVKAICRNPLVMDALVADPRLPGIVEVEPDMEPGMIARRKGEGEVRAGIRNVLGFTSFDDLTGELSSLADLVLGTLWTKECRKNRLVNAPLAVFALGKFGTHEILFGADLDLLFVSDSNSRINKERLEKIASGFISALSFHYEEGRLYEVDARLRPEGRNAPLVVDDAAYTAYLGSRASLWERQSLTRLRFVCGERDLGVKVSKTVEGFVYHSPLPPQWADTIVSMRRKIETRSRTRAGEFFDLKLGPGGMVDAEFLAQMIQLRFGLELPSLRGRRATAVFDLAAHGGIAQEDAGFLVTTYRIFRELEKLMRITLEERGSLLPENAALDLLARCYDGSAGDQLRHRVHWLADSMRTRFLALSKGLQSSSFRR